MNNYHFERTCHSYGYDYTRNPESYGNKYTDYKIESYLNDWKISIKDVDGDDVWLDLSEKGWVYNNDCDFIVFKCESEYLFITPPELRLLIKQNLIDKETYNISDARYKIYHCEKNRKPVTLFKLSDLENYKSFTWKF